MGAEGSFSEEAALKYIAKRDVKDAEIIYLVKAELVLTAIEDGSIDLGIFPIENSNGGIVIEAVYAMAKHRFQVRELFEIDVHQNLIAMKGVSLGDITEITSHDQALKQSRMYLKRTFPHMPITEYEDTAKAAKDLSFGILPPTTAVIASKRAAELYGLDILGESVQDLKFNYTSFVVAEKRTD